MTTLSTAPVSSHMPPHYLSQVSSGTTLRGFPDSFEAFQNPRTASTPDNIQTVDHHPPGPNSVLSGFRTRNPAISSGFSHRLMFLRKKLSPEARAAVAADRESPSDPSNRVIHTSPSSPALNTFSRYENKDDIDAPTSSIPLSTMSFKALGRSRQEARDFSGMRVDFDGSRGSGGTYIDATTNDNNGSPNLSSSSSSTTPSPPGSNSKKKTRPRSSTIDPSDPNATGSSSSPPNRGRGTPPRLRKKSDFNSSRTYRGNFDDLSSPPAAENPSERVDRLEREAEAKRINDGIDREIELEKRRWNKWGWGIGLGAGLEMERERGAPKGKGKIKLLLLGPAESGKSTFLKQLRMKYDRPNFELERESYRLVILLFIVYSARALLYILESEPNNQNPNPNQPDHRSSISSSSGPGHQSPTPSPATTSASPLLRRMRLAPVLSLEETLRSRIGAVPIPASSRGIPPSLGSFGNSLGKHGSTRKVTVFEGPSMGSSSGLGKWSVDVRTRLTAGDLETDTDGEERLDYPSGPVRSPSDASDHSTAAATVAETETETEPLSSSPDRLPDSFGDAMASRTETDEDDRRRPSSDETGPSSSSDRRTSTTRIVSTSLEIDNELHIVPAKWRSASGLLVGAEAAAAAAYSYNPPESGNSKRPSFQLRRVSSRDSHTRDDGNRNGPTTTTTTTDTTYKGHSRLVPGWTGWKARENNDLPVFKLKDENDPAHLIVSCKTEIKEAYEEAIRRGLLSDGEGNRGKWNLGECAQYFLDHLDRIAVPGYVPNDNDILRVRIRTIGVDEHFIRVQELVYHVVDVAGAKGARHTWAQFFEDATAIVFICAISGYDEYVAEEPKKNKMRDALNLWESLCQNRLLKKADFILFLNKADLLKLKLKSHQSPVTKFFPEFSGSEKIDDVAKFFRAKFRSRAEPRSIFAHLTNALDHRAMGATIASVNDRIIRRSLEDAGML